MTSITGVATSFIDFTRASNATVTDSDGRVKWAPHNLLLASESFDASAWAKSSVTPTANSIAAPNGTTTADTLAASGANGTTLQTFTAEAISYTFAVWLKRKTGTGTIEIAADSGTYTAVTITSDWALYTVTQTPAAGSKSAGIRIVTSADEVYAWGAALYRSDLGGMQPNTSAYPMYNPTTPKNLLGWTESFGNAAWLTASSNGGAVGVKTPNYGVAPDGSLTATRIQLDVTAASVNGQSQVYQQFTSVVGTVYNRSAWVKTNDGSTKTIMGFQAAGSTPATLTVTGEWTRLSSVRTASATNDFLQLLLLKGTTSDTADLLVWRPQVSDSASLDPYVPVYGAAVTSAAYYGPRRDFDPVTLACKGLLVEEQRVNLAFNSQDYTNAYWPKPDATITATAAVAPTGTSIAQKFVATATSAIHSIEQSVAGLGTSANLSIYAKKAEYNFCTVLLTGSGIRAARTFNLTTGEITNPYDTSATVGAVTATNVGNGWWRISVAATSAGFTGARFCLAFDTSTGFSNSGQTFTGDGTSGIFIWGIQAEAGTFPTSYIPTGAATATRNADVASVSTQAFPYSASEGTLVANFTPTNVAAARRALQLDDATENERITLGTNSTPNGLMTVIDGGSSQASIATGTPAANTTMKLAARFKVNDFAVSANGAAVGTDTSGTLPTVTTLRLGSGTSSTEPLNGWLRQVTYLPRALTDAELIVRSA